MKKLFARVRLTRHRKNRARTARFGVSIPELLPGGFELVGVEEVEPEMEVADERARLGHTILLYERRWRRRDRLSITQGYTTPARVAGAPDGSFGEVQIGDLVATWIDGDWEVDVPVDIPPSQNPDARWVEGNLRMTWVGDDKVSTTLESNSASLVQLTRIAAYAAGGDSGPESW